MESKAHWDKVYSTRRPEEVSWYRPHLETSLGLITQAAPDHGAAIIDVGGGEATLVDDLLACGYRNLYVLDISATALAVAQARLGSASSQGALAMRRHHDVPVRSSAVRCLARPRRVSLPHRQARAGGLRPAGSDGAQARWPRHRCDLRARGSDAMQRAGSGALRPRSAPRRIRWTVSPGRASDRAAPDAGGRRAAIRLLLVPLRRLMRRCAPKATDVVYESTITCPVCGHRKTETMPTDACQWFYDCDNCRTLLKPKPGDCCVFCSFGTVACPPRQQGCCA